MADSNILREFLVKIGYSVDRSSQRDADASIESTTKYVGRLSTTATAMGAAVAYGVGKAVNELSKLGYTSERTRSSVGGLNAFAFAAQQLGSSSQEAMSAVEGLAERLRKMPGTEGLLQKLGVSTRDGNGQLKGTVAMLRELAPILKNMPQFQAERYAQKFGIPERLLLAMQNGQFGQYFQQENERESGLKLDKAADDAQSLYRQLNQVWRTIHNIGLASAGNIENGLGPDLERLSAWMTNHGSDIAQTIADDTETLVNMIQKLDTWGDKLSTTLNKIMSWEQKMGKDGGPIQRWSSKHNFHIPGTDMSVGEFLARSAAATSDIPVLRSIVPGSLQKESTAAVKADEASDLRKRQNQAMAFFQKNGFTRAQASGIVANLTAESKLDPNATGDGGKAHGIAQWHPARRQGYSDYTKERYGAVRNFGHSTFNDQLRYVLYEMQHGESRAGRMLRNAKSASDAGSIVSRYYERPADAEGEAQKRAAMANTINSNATYNIYGQTDPQGTAREVERTQNRHNSAVVRNMKPQAR